MGKGWILQMRQLAVGIILSQCHCPPWVGIDTTFRHNPTSLHPKLLLPSNHHGQTASSMKACMGTRMLLLPAPTPDWVTAKGLPRQIGTESDLSPCPTVGHRGSRKHE